MALASDLNRGDCFNYNNEIIKVVRKEVITVGTHSHTKLKLFVKNIFTSSEKVLTLAHNDKVDIVEAQMKQGQLISKQDTKAQVMDTHSYETFDAEINDNIKDQINEGDNIVFLEVNNRRIIVDKGK